MGGVRWSWRRAWVGAALGVFLFACFGSRMVVNRVHLWQEGRPIVATVTSSEDGPRAHCRYAYVVGDRRYTGSSEGDFCDGAYRLEPVTVLYWPSHPWVNELNTGGNGFAAAIVAGVIVVLGGGYFAGGTSIGVLVAWWLRPRDRPVRNAGVVSR